MPLAQAFSRHLCSGRSGHRIGAEVQRDFRKVRLRGRVFFAPPSGQRADRVAAAQGAPRGGADAEPTLSRQNGQRRLLGPGHLPPYPPWTARPQHWNALQSWVTSEVVFHRAQLNEPWRWQWLWKCTPAQRRPHIPRKLRGGTLPAVTCRLEFPFIPGKAGTTTLSKSLSIWWLIDGISLFSVAFPAHSGGTRAGEGYLEGSDC